ncbi:F-box/kelch-repeat protein At3g23880-like [Cornus florida]|uniref:F-box/kelch-repeat protein At3g23880-like n=1 Tax=Cornus florida TaxID=4283 RepID=UPI002896C51E|nr:F-box/kelch-repeat protein At3g23880-like [Cornus florida]
MADLLPEELITEILTRLPVKILVQMRCVCKSWCSLITSCYFINSKLNQTIHFNKFNNARTLVIAHYINGEEKGEGRVSINLYDERVGTCPIEIDSPIPNCGSDFRIYGSCNGLVCLTDNAFDHVNSLILWNPSIRKSVRLPKPSIGIDSHTDTYSKVASADSSAPNQVVIGYGFDSKSNDYKVVRIARLHNFPDPEVGLYSLNKGCWRRICVVGPHHRIGCNPLASQAFVNGVVHWVGRNVDSASDISILSFDMSSEVFCEMKLPGSPADDGWLVTNIVVSVLGESLCVVHFDSLVSEVKIWVMKEYGVVESWNKLISFEVDSFFGMTLAFRWYGDLLFFRINDYMFSINLDSQDPRNDGLLFFNRNHHLFSFNKESEQAKDLGIRLSGDMNSFYIVNYMESLVLL